MWLTGHRDGPPLSPDTSVFRALRPVIQRLALASSAWGRRVDVDPGALVTMRAATTGLRRRGRISASGSCRLLAAADGRWIAVNLARAVDRESVQAVVRGPVHEDPWEALIRSATCSPAAELEERAHLLEVPAAVLGRRTPRAPGAWWRARRVGAAAAPPTIPLVVDLSAMWAGPQCAALLGRAGARVVKVESAARPDGARSGPTEFFNLLHDGHESVVLDFAAPEGREALRRLLSSADVVVDSSRSRAMRQLGIEPEQVVRRRPGVTWVSITAYGRGGSGASRVGFGDDAAVAGGLVARDGKGWPVFCGDAIADPLAGIAAAAGAASAIAAGGGHLVEVTLYDVAKRAAAGPPMEHRRVAPHGGAWWVECDEPVLVRPPAATLALQHGGAHPAGADTAAVLAELAA